MIEWILVILVHVGPFSDKDSNSLTNVPGFKTEAECVAAAKAVSSITDGTTKLTKTRCIQRSK